jgi:hypothetical protein
MPIFSEHEYLTFEDRPSLDEAWDRLPVVKRIAGLRIRWLGPLVNLGHDGWIEDLSGAAWGQLTDCGWEQAMDQSGPMMDKRGRVRRRWAAALHKAVELLAEAGGCEGPEGDSDRWASWVCYELSEPRAVIQAAATRRGWDR